MALKKPQSQPASKSTSAKQTVKIETVAERLSDMRAHGREVRKSKDSAVAFLQRAGILNHAGKLSKPYRG
jgi:hypothetical protein